MSLLDLRTEKLRAPLTSSGQALASKDKIMYSINIHIHLVVLLLRKNCLGYVFFFTVGQDKIQWTTDKLMSLVDQNYMQRSNYQFENVKIKKGWGSGRE